MILYRLKYKNISVKKFRLFRGIGAEQLLALLNKAMDKIESSEKNPLEMLSELKKIRKEK